MPTKISNAKYSIKDIWLYSNSRYRNRFDYRDRDVLKRVDVNEIKVYTKDRRNMPSTKYEIKTYSYPQYEPYFSKKGKKSKKQRKVKHQYEQTYILESLNWNSKFKWRIGGQRKWPDESKINWNQIEQVHSSIKEKYEKKYGKGTDKYKETIIKHKKKARYISKGDFISQKFGLNGDWYWRVQGNAFLSGNLFGLAWEKNKTGEGVPFFGKHDLRVIKFLLEKKILTR